VVTARDPAAAARDPAVAVAWHPAVAVVAAWGTTDPTTVARRRRGGETTDLTTVARRRRGGETTGEENGGGSTALS
jgi:hypothetical protein